VLAYAVGIPLLAILAMTQSVILSEITLLDGRPDLVMLVVLAWALAGEPSEAMALGLVGGWFLDLTSSLPFGTHAMILILIPYLVSFTEGRMWGENLLLAPAVALGASLILHGWGLGALALMGRDLDLPFALSRVVLPSTVLNMVLAIPISQLAASFRRTVHPPEVSL
jgi:rod shape-determining protein MreD